MFDMTCYCCGRLHQEMNTRGSSSVAKHGDGLGISTKVLDVLLDPLESRDLVHQPVVSHLRVLVRRRVGVEEAQDAQPVVEGDDDEVAVRGEDPAVEEVACTPAVGLSVNKHHHRQAFRLCKMKVDIIAKCVHHVIINDKNYSKPHQS